MRTTMYWRNKPAVEISTESLIDSGGFESLRLSARDANGDWLTGEALTSLIEGFVDGHNLWMEE